VAPLGLKIMGVSLPLINQEIAIHRISGTRVVRQGLIGSVSANMHRCIFCTVSVLYFLLVGFSVDC